MSSQRVLVLPFPAQSHVNCLMILSQKLAQNGLKITFVNSDFNHRRVVNAMKTEEERETKLPLELVSIPDGMGPEDDRNDMAKLSLAILSTMSSEFEKLLEDIHGRDGRRISCIVADVNMAWALEIAHKLGIKAAVICPTSAALFAFELHMPKLIQDGLMDSDGMPIVKGEFEISPEIPKMNTADIAWCCMGDSTSQKLVYDYIARMIRTSHLTDWWLCNTVSELERGALSLYPKILPIGPLMKTHEIQTSSWSSLGQFWEEDLSCLSWLNQQPPCSVIYIAFGSFTMFDQTQFKELALGLELTQKPFLWVVREDAYGRDTKVTYPDEFEGKKGKIVRWVPQQKVLSHPAIACFVSHCGWNSTMEGLSNGVPFLCWPYFADQFFDKTCICDYWKVGLGFDLDDDKGLISRQEIKKKLTCCFKMRASGQGL
ncbi:UDP-glycosyltransferase 83A1-like [Prosopis cineraria]|uniref:UDP-glycosyltransferase 83A1-like n=1 Tax=Prosopis cineraria TaxID=364024 RepID=UPI00240FFC2B|nr:UDP-glycosyltransferase 83A1-like [Prosopis cineraria]